MRIAEEIDNEMYELKILELKKQQNTLMQKLSEENKGKLNYFKTNSSNSLKAYQ